MPQPEKQVTIPELSGGARMLGIPTILDCFIQKALFQQLAAIYETTFSSDRYGFRPLRTRTRQCVRLKTTSAGGTNRPSISILRSF